MAGSSNRDLWQILTGHSALRDHAAIEKEVMDFLPRLQGGVAYYRPPSAAAEKRLRESGRVRSKNLPLVLDISSHLQLDQEQAFELFESYLINAHRGTLSELGQRVSGEGGKWEVVGEVASHYLRERLHILRCLKHMLGFWQDPNHPFRDVYAACVGELTKDETSLISSLWDQYRQCVDTEPPTGRTSNEERAWTLQSLTEQVEVLETILLYFKDFVHLPHELKDTARLMHEYGFGLRQSSKVSLVEGADVLQQHIRHLCSLILVESLDLDSVLKSLDSPSLLEEHHLLQSDSSAVGKGLDALFSEWGDQDCHAPILLGWALLNFAGKQHSEGLVVFRLLGNRALKAHVFEYLLRVLSSPFFSKNRPVAGVCKSVVHTLVAVAVTQFSEDSLGDSQDLVAIAALTLTHPPLQLQLWEQGLSVGVGVLVHSAISHFPFLTSPLSSLLLSLAGDAVSAQQVWQLLASLQYFTEPVPVKAMGHQVCLEVGDGDGDGDGEEGERLRVVKPRSFYTQEASWLGCHGVVMTAGLCGAVWTGWGGESLVSWPLPGYSGWNVLAMETVRLLQSPGLDSSAEQLVTRVTETANLITQMLKSDWSLAAALHPITSQYFSILQRCCSLPRPPCTLLAACLSCIAVMATNNTAETWALLGRTGFLPYMAAAHSSDQLDQLGVSPGHYGHLLKMVERPEGKYPVSMAMLDLLATTCHPSNSAVSREQVASVAYVMREVFSCCHKWKFRTRSAREELELKLLQLCHGTLERHRASPYPLGSFVSGYLLTTPGEHTILHLLSLPVDRLDVLYSAALGTASLSTSTESVHLSLSIVEHLLHSTEQRSSLLEWNLANTCPHIVSNIASYIFHHGDTRIPLGATVLLTKLCQVAPLSVFALLGPDAVAKRDAFVSRLGSHVESEDLKRAILELLRAAVVSQPALAELFLSVQAPGRPGKPPQQLAIEDSSCLHKVLKIIDSDKRAAAGFPPSLLPPALHLLHSLWHGRHDAVLHALRNAPNFWKHVTTPLFLKLDLASAEAQPETTTQLLAASHVMHIVAMEMYYVFQGKLDDTLKTVLKEFISTGGMKTWNQCLKNPSDCDGMADVMRPLTPAFLEAQHSMVVGWKTLLMVANSNQASRFALSDPQTQSDVLTDILAALESQLAAPVSMVTVGMATELSLLVMVLVGHWQPDFPVEGDLIGRFSHILHHVTRLDQVLASPLSLHLHSSLLTVLRVARASRVSVDTRYLLGLVPFLSETLRCRHDDSKGPSHRPDVAAAYLLAEMVCGISNWSSWLQVFRNYSVVPMLVQMMEDRLKLQKDESLIEAILGVFIAMATSRAGAEALLVSGLLQVMSLPLCGCLDNKLNPAPIASQVPGTPVLRPHPPTGWSRVWQLSLRVAGLICHALPHLSLPPLLDFTGAHQHRITMALDIMEAIHSLQALETTRSSAFFSQQLFHYRRQVHFALPLFHTAAAEASLQLLGALAAVLSHRGTLKHIVKTMHAAGLLPSNYGPPAGRGRVQLLPGNVDESWVTGSLAFSELQKGLMSTLTSCLATIKNFSPTLKDIVMATGHLDREEYPAVFQPSLAPPTLDQTTPPTLGTLTTCLSVGLELLKLEPRVGTPSKSPSKSSPSRQRLAVPGGQRRGEILCLLEHAVVLCVGQALCLLSDPALSSHDQQLLRKELANEMGTFSHGLLLVFHRRGAPSPSSSSQAPPTAFQEVWSGKSGSLAFSEEQAVFRLADSFVRQYLPC